MTTKPATIIAVTSKEARHLPVLDRAAALGKEAGATATAGYAVVTSSPSSAEAAGANAPSSNVPTANTVVARIKPERGLRAAKDVGKGPSWSLGMCIWTASSLPRMTGFAQLTFDSRSIAISQSMSVAKFLGKHVHQETILPRPVGKVLVAAQDPHSTVGRNRLHADVGGRRVRLIVLAG